MSQGREPRRGLPIRGFGGGHKQGKPLKGVLLPAKEEKEIIPRGGG